MTDSENTENSADLNGLAPALQALLLSSAEPLDVATLASVCNVDQETVENTLDLIQRELSSENFGFALVKVAKGYQFRTKAQFARFIRTLKQEAPRKLSAQALETLAIIAYRQPVVKHDIDRLRGVDVLPTLKTLLDRNLVSVVGHKETVGHPSLYATTDEFLRIFGLNSLEDLPSVKELGQIEAKPGEDGAVAFENPELQDQDKHELFQSESFQNSALEEENCDTAANQIEQVTETEISPNGLECASAQDK